MASRFLGLGIQTDVRCASGALVAFLEPESLASCSAVLSPTEPESLTFEIPRDDDRASEVTVGRVVRTTFVDATDDREWDITDVADSAVSGRLQVTAQPIALRLARVIYQGTNAITGAPEFAFDDTQAAIADVIDSRVIAACDAAGLTWIERGTIDSAALIDLSGEWASALEIVQAIAEPGRAAAEWQLRRNGDTDYRLDLLDEIGSSAATVQIRTAVNLLDNRRTREVANVATRVFARGSTEGSERTMAAHLWRVASVVSGSILQLEDIQGGDGPILYDDQLNGLYFAPLNSHTFASLLVTDSDAATQRITVSSTAGISAGQWGRFFAASGANGARVVSLTRPTAIAAPSAGGLGDRALVLDRPALRGDCNLVPNPSMRDYASASDAPDNWTDTAGTPANRTVAREATIVRDAPYTCRFTTTGTTTLSLETPDIRPWAIAERRHACAIWFNVQAVPAAQSAALIFELITSAGVLIQELSRWVRGQAPQLDTWIRFIPNPVDLSAITSAVRLRVRVADTVSANAAAGWDVVFGPALLAESEVAGIADIDYSGGTALWQEANRELPKVSGAIRGYDVGVLDLARDDAANFAHLGLTPGGQVEVTDTDLGETVALRLLEYRPDYLDPAASTLRLGVAAPDLATDVQTPRGPVVESIDVRFSVSESTSENGSTGTVTLTVRDPLGTVSAVEYRTISARGNWGNWVAMTPGAAGVYVGTVALSEKVPARLNWRIRGIDGWDGPDQVLAENVVTFAMSPTPAAPAIEANYREDGTVDVAVIGDADTASLQIGFSTVSQAAANAALGSTQNARLYKFPAVGSLTLGQRAFIAAKAWSGTGASGSGSEISETEITRFNTAGSKTVRIAASGALIPYTQTASFVRDLDYFTALSEVGYTAAIPVPKGATLTAVRVRSYIGDAGDISDPSWNIFLRRIEQSGTSTQIGTAVSTVLDTWETLAISSLSESTAGDRSYLVICTPVFAFPGSTNTARIAWIEYDIDYPDVTINT
jgi:hypothetical protein